MATESGTATEADVTHPTDETPAETVESAETCDTTPESVDSGGDLSLDVAFDIVKNERRRLVLEYLDEADGPVSLGELAEHIAAIENEKEVSAINSTERKRVYVGLYQCHLPKMEDAGVVESERNSNIALGENAPTVMQYVNVEDETRPWHRYYLGLSVGGVLATSLAVATGIGTAVLPGFVIVAMLATATVHTLDTTAQD